MNKKILMGILLTLATSTYANTINSNAVCTLKEPNQINMIECSMERYDKYDHKLNVLYQNKMKTLQKNQANKLRIAQKKWISKKEANCNTYTEEESGSNGPLESSECSIEMIKERIEFLKRYK